MIPNTLLVPKKRRWQHRAPAGLVDAACALGDVADTSANSQARQRLSDQVLLNIHSHLATAHGNQHAPSESRWLSGEVKIIDGACLSMPDTAENQAACLQPSN
jgi:hypothetical protein